MNQWLFILYLLGGELNAHACVDNTSASVRFETGIPSTWLKVTVPN